jgi:hypothetical protein
MRGRAEQSGRLGAWDLESDIDRRRPMARVILTLRWHGTEGYRLARPKGSSLPSPFSLCRPRHAPPWQRHFLTSPRPALRTSFLQLTRRFRQDTIHARGNRHPDPDRGRGVASAGCGRRGPRAGPAGGFGGGYPLHGRWRGGGTPVIGDVCSSSGMPRYCCACTCSCGVIVACRDGSRESVSCLHTSHFALRHCIFGSKRQHHLNVEFRNVCGCSYSAV